MSAEQVVGRGRRGAGENDESGLKEYVLFAPRIVKLDYRLMRDRRVPYRPKIIREILDVAASVVVPDWLKKRLRA